MSNVTLTKPAEYGWQCLIKARIIVALLPWRRIFSRLYTCAVVSALPFCSVTVETTRANKSWVPRLINKSLRPKLWLIDPCKWSERGRKLTANPKADALCLMNDTAVETNTHTQTHTQRLVLEHSSRAIFCIVCNWFNVQRRHGAPSVRLSVCHRKRIFPFLHWCCLSLIGSNQNLLGDSLHSINPAFSNRNGDALAHNLSRA